MGLKDNLVVQDIWNKWVFFLLDFVMFFCVYMVIYLTDLAAGFFTTKNHKIHTFFYFQIHYYII